MRHVSCDVCRADDAVLFAERPARWDVLHARFVRCRTCGFIYADPRATDEEARRHYGAVEERGSSALGVALDSEEWRRAVHARRLHLEPVVAHLQSHRVPRFLELGFGDASALAAAVELGWEAHGLEYAPWLVDAARDRLGLEEVRIGGLEDGRFAEGSFDVVYAWHVIEHVLDIHAWLRELHRVLRPGGMLILGTESAAGLYGRVWRLSFRLAGRTSWPPTSTDHTYWFRAEDLARLLRDTGFDVARMRTYENPPSEVARTPRPSVLRSPRAAFALDLYLLTSVVALAAPALGGKLHAVAVRR